MAGTVEELITKIDMIPDKAAKEAEFSLTELLAIAAAREVKDDDVVFTGTGLPMLGFLTANFLYSPHAILILESGVYDGKAMHIPSSVGDYRGCYMSSTLGGLVDTFGYYLERGYVTLGFLGAASVDRYGGVNVTSVGDYFCPEHRFCGSGGNSDIGTMSKRVIYMMRHEKRKFLERNDYTTTPGWWCYDWPSGKWRPKREVWKDTPFAESGPAAVISDMGVFRFDEDGIMYLDTYHPGLSPAKVVENCSFDLNISLCKGETLSPTYQQLFVLREFVDPERIFLPEQLPEYPPEIKEIIEE